MGVRRAAVQLQLILSLWARVADPWRSAVDQSQTAAPPGIPHSVEGSLVPQLGNRNICFSSYT